MLWLFQWQSRTVFLRLTENGSQRPPCPCLYDQVWAIPVVDRTARPPIGMKARRFLAVGDWIADVLED